MLRVMMNVLRKDSAPHRKHIPFDKNVVKKVSNARACGKQLELYCIFPQVRKY